MPYMPNKRTRSWIPEKKAFQRKNTSNKVYQTYRWRMFSKRYKENHPLCVKCEAKGIITAATVADHIVRVAVGGAMYDESNIQSLCTSCHNSKSGKESHGYKENKGGIPNNR